MARFILKEDFNVKWDGLAILLVIAGSGVCILFSKNDEESHSFTEEETIELFGSFRSVIFVIFVYAFMLFAWILANITRRKILQVYFVIQDKYIESMK
jgi:O-antigen/teichoic acid export membrane protein